MLKKALKEIAVFSPVKIISPLLSLVTFPISLRYFSQEEYGMISLVTSSVSLFNAFTLSWIGYVIVRYFEKYKRQDRLGEFLTTFWTISVFLIAIIEVLFFLYSRFRLISIGYFPLFVILLSIPFNITNGYLLTLLQLNGNTKAYNFYGILLTIGNFLLFLICIYVFRFRIEAGFIPVVFLGAILLLIEGNNIKKRFNLKIGSLNRQMLNEGLKFGLPQIGVTAGVLILSIGDRFIIEYFCDQKSLGVYSAAYKIGELLIMIPTGIIATTISPLIYRTYENNGLEETKKLIKNIVSLYLIILIPIIVFISLKTDVVIPLLGKKYIESVTLIPYILIGTFLFGVCHFTGMYLQILEKNHVFMNIIIGSGIFNLILTVILVQLLGLFGAALATLIAYVLYYFLVEYFSSGKVGQTCFDMRTLKIILAILPFAIFLRFFSRSCYDISTIFTVLIGLISYFLLLWYFKENFIYNFVKQINK